MDLSKTVKITILGCGLMGTALLQGWLRDQGPKYTFNAYVRTETSLERLQHDLDSYETQGRISYWTGDSLAQAAANADIIVLGFLPKDLERVMCNPELLEVLKSKLVVSLLAGVSLSNLNKAIAGGVSVQDLPDLRISRVIPTMAAKIGESVTLVAEDSTSQPVFACTASVRELFSQIGSTISVPETLMNEATAIGAAVHALAIVAIDSITDASVAEGVPRATASALAAESLRSVCGLMLQGNMTPESVKQSMSTPGGITLNAVVNLDAGVRGGVAAATRSAIQYTRRMND